MLTSLRGSSVIILSSHMHAINARRADELRQEYVVLRQNYTVVSQLLTMVTLIRRWSVKLFLI